MKVLIACDKFKGSLSAKEVATYIEKGFKEVFPTANFVTTPIADGGEGFVSSLVDAQGGKIVTSQVEDAQGNVITAEWGIIPTASGTHAGVIEMSAASGLWRIGSAQNDIMSASTYGTGQLIKIAAETPQVDHLYVGLGGSATNDGGTGMAQALGVSFSEDNERITPRNLLQILKANLTNRIPLPPITVACDVDNPLCGPNGASAIFGPQKGASAEQVLILDSLLHHLSEVTDSASLATLAGAGAAGGLGFGMMVFTDAKLVSGFDLVADALSLEEAVRSADLIITGEGGLDSQSLSGKGPIGVAKLAQKHQKPCLAIAGKIEHDVDWSPFFHKTAALIDTGVAIDELIENTSKHLIKLSQKLAEDIKNNSQIF